MEKVTKDRSLTAKENVIKNLINSNNEDAVNAFVFMYNHYQFEYVTGNSNYFPVLKAIYVENVKMPKWKLAQYCGVSRTTLFDYRHEIIRCFYLCINNALR